MKENYVFVSKETSAKLDNHLAVMQRIFGMQSEADFTLHGNRLGMTVSNETGKIFSTKYAVTNNSKITGEFRLSVKRLRSVWPKKPFYFRLDNNNNFYYKYDDRSSGHLAVENAKRFEIDRKGFKAKEMPTAFKQLLFASNKLVALSPIINKNIEAKMGLFVLNNTPYIWGGDNYHLGAANFPQKIKLPEGSDLNLLYPVSYFNDVLALFDAETALSLAVNSNYTVFSNGEDELFFPAYDPNDNLTAIIKNLLQKSIKDTVSCKVDFTSFIDIVKSFDALQSNDSAIKIDMKLSSNELFLTSANVNGSMQHSLPVYDVSDHKGFKVSLDHRMLIAILNKANANKADLVIHAGSNATFIRQNNKEVMATWVQLNLN